MANSVTCLENKTKENTAHISKKVKHGIKWQFIANVITTVVYFANGIILARILIPKDFGLYGMAQLLSNFVFMFWQLGINSAIIQRENISEKHLNTAFTISLIMGSLCFCITWIGAPFLARFFQEPSVALLSRLIGITFIIYALDRVPSALLGRNLHFKKISLVGIANPVLYGVIAIPLALIGYGPFSFVWGIIAGAFAMTAIRIYWGFKYFNWKPRFLIDFECAKHLLSFGIFITLSGIMSFFSSNMQRIITGRFLGSVGMGYFTKASNFGHMPVEKVRGNIITVLLPGFSRIQKDPVKIRDWFRKFNFFTYALVTPALVFLAAFPKETIIGLFGDKWLPTASILPLLSLSVLLLIPNMFFSNILQAVGKPYISFFVTGVLIIPFTVGLLIGAKYGLMGISIAILSYSAIFLISYLIVLEINNTIKVIDFLKSFLEPLLVSLAIALLTLGAYNLFQEEVMTSELKLLFAACVYGGLTLCYYFYRITVRSYVNYLGFDIRKVVKI